MTSTLKWAKICPPWRGALQRYKQELEKIKGIECLKRLKKAVLEVKSLEEFEEILRKVKGK